MNIEKLSYGNKIVKYFIIATLVYGVVAMMGAIIKRKEQKMYVAIWFS